jgi:hypothetical protein
MTKNGTIPELEAKRAKLIEKRAVAWAVSTEANDKARVLSSKISEISKKINNLKMAERYPEETNSRVVSFTKKMGGRTYEYAAIHAAGAWWTTGPTCPPNGMTCPPNGMTWRQLIDFIRRDNQQNSAVIVRLGGTLAAASTITVKVKP